MNDPHVVSTPPCQADAPWWYRLGCRVQSWVAPLCERRTDGSLTCAARMGRGLWRVFSAFTACNCCHGYRVLVVFTIGVIAGCTGWWPIALAGLLLMGGLLARD